MISFFIIIGLFLHLLTHRGNYELFAMPSLDSIASSTQSFVQEIDVKNVGDTFKTTASNLQSKVQEIDVKNVGDTFKNTAGDIERKTASLDISSLETDTKRYSQDLEDIVYNLDIQSINASDLKALFKKKNIKEEDFIEVEKKIQSRHKEEDKQLKKYFGSGIDFQDFSTTVRFGDNHIHDFYADDCPSVYNQKYNQLFQPKYKQNQFSGFTKNWVFDITRYNSEPKVPFPNSAGYDD
jgi:hypothetical protein